MSELTKSLLKKQPYSLRNLILAGDRLPKNSWEKTVSKEMEQETGIGANHRGNLIPDEALCSRSDLALGTNSLGGYLVQTSVEPTIADALIPYAILPAAGMTILPGLRSNLQIPRWATPSSPSGYAGNATVTTAATEAQTFSALTLGPALRVSQYTKLSRQLLVQEAFDGEAYARREILRMIGSMD